LKKGKQRGTIVYVTRIVTSRHSFMIAVTVRVNNHCPTFLWWRFTVSWRI